MKTTVKSVNVDLNNVDCSPMSNIYYNLKMRLKKDLNIKDVTKIYNCNLCNSCHLAGFNLNTREKVVDKSIVLPEITEIRKNIGEYGNSYGEQKSYTRSTANEIDDPQETMETVLFRGCTPTYKTPEILQAAETLLETEGIKYSVMDDETCCGNILFNMGDKNGGNEVVKANIDKFKKHRVKRIITICPGCYNAFNEYYKEIIGFKPEIVLAIDMLKEQGYSDEELVVQDPCHARQKAGTVRKILLSALNENVASCCGAGGGLKAHNSSLANARAKKIVDNISPRIVTYCPFCYLNLNSINSNKITDIYMLLVENKEVSA